MAPTRCLGASLAALLIAATATLVAVPTRALAQVEAPTSTPFVTFRVFATIYDPHIEGSVEVAVPDKCAKFAALGQTGNLAAAQCPPGYRLDMNWRVRVSLNGSSEVIPVKDVGPWNTNDNYWNPPSGHPRPRRTFTDLPRGKPAAQAAFQDGYNEVVNCKELDGTPTDRTAGADEVDRCVLNPAGIDLSVEAARKLGMNGSQWVDVSFLWEPARGGYVLDGYGGLHSYNGAPPARGLGWWPGWDIARGIAVRPDGQSGYVVDGWGAVFPFGVNPDAVPAPNATGYFHGRDVARGIVLDPADATGSRGYVVDHHGGLHPFGGAPGVFGTGWFPDRDHIRGVVVNPRTNQYPYVTGYVLGAFGDLHPFAERGRALPPTPAGAASWNWDIARSIVLTGFGVGYTLSGWGSIHAFGGAPPATGGLYLEGRDIFRGLVWDANVGGGYALGGLGGIYAFNGAPTPDRSGSFNTDIANAIGG